MTKKITMYRNKNESTISVIDAPQYEAMDVEGWEGVHVEDMDVFMFVFNIQANAKEFPIHSSGDTWLAYVISGSGTLYAGTECGQKREGASYQAGDFIVFEANTPHGWANNGSDSKILFTKHTRQ